MDMSNSELRIEEGPTQSRVACLRVSGRLDADTARQFLERCEQVQARGQNLVLNLSEITLLGSSGVGALLALVEQFQDQAGSVRFAALSPAAQSVIDLLDLGGYLSIHADEAGAMSAMAVSP
jgi:anti-anti-sigma factor